MDEKFQKAKKILNSMTNAIYKQYLEREVKRKTSKIARVFHALCNGKGE